MKSTCKTNKKIEVLVKVALKINNYCIHILNALNYSIYPYITTIHDPALVL